MTPETLSFELAATYLRDAVFVLDPGGKILWANQAAAVVACRNAQSLVNLRLTDILTPRSSEIAESVFGSERPPGGAPALIELDILRPDLSSRRLEVSLSRLAGNNSQTLVAIARDVSERHLLDEERRRADFQTLQFQVALLELGRSESSNLEEFLTHVTALSAATLDVARVSVWVYSETYAEIRCAHLFDREQGLHESGAVLEVDRYPRHFGALKDFRTIAACDARNDPQTAELTDYLGARGTVSVLDVPIRREGKPIGVLCYEHTGQPRRWKLDEQNFAASLADLTALALETNRRRLAESELRESLDNLELFFSQSLDGFFFMMLDQPVRWGDNVNQDETLDYVFEHQRITKINGAMLDQYGASREQFLGWTPRDLFAHDLAHGRELWRRMFDAGRLHVESDERRLDGSRMWVEGDYICFYDAEGRITGHFGIQRDITERKHAEEALLRFNRRLRLLQQTDRAILSAHSLEEIAQAAMVRIHELVPCRRASVVVFDPGAGLGRIIGVYAPGAAQPDVGSEVPLGIFGSLDDLRHGRPHTIADIDQVAVQEPATRLRQQGIRSFVNIPLVAQDDLIGVLNLGSENTSAFTSDHIEIAQEVADSLAVAIRHAHLNREIERHAAELEQRVVERTAELSEANANLRESEDRLAGVFRSAMDAIVVIDQQRVIVIFNQAAETIFRCGSSEVVGQSIDRFLSEDLVKLLENYIAAAESRSGEGRLWIPEGLRAIRQDGERFPIEATVSRTVVSSGTLFTLILRDINQRKQAEEMLEQLRRQNVYLKEELQSEVNFEELVGASAAMQKIFRSIEMVARTDSNVLLLGETGTGKELIARALHNLSRRKQNVIVKVNCAALPAGLVESELFGHEKGAFTGAVSQKKGRFELAHQGTIFLDEVGELPLDTQTKLLRVLQEQEFERVGGSHTLRVDVRVIAATNRNLAEDVRRGAFRADLFYRLNVFPIEVPPLRQRKEDIRLLAKDLAQKSSQRMGKRIQSIDRAALDRLESYHWPGNVRELANIIERAVILCRGDILQEAHIALSNETPAHAGSFQTLEEAERGHILRALERTGWVLAGPQGAAALLGMNRSTLWSRMKKLGIEASKTS
jgi:formate hydrogenlyase transcriptional activator